MVKIGLISLIKLITLEKLCRCFEKHVPRAVLDKTAGMMGYTLFGEETAKFHTFTSINLNERFQKVAAIMKLLVYEENDELENDMHSFVDNTTHLTTAFLRLGVEMSML